MNNKSLEKKVVAALMGVNVVNTLTPWAALYTETARLSPPRRQGRSRSSMSPGR